jgi:hypothetical protein
VEPTFDQRPTGGLEECGFPALAFLSFLLALFDVAIGSVDLVVLGLLFLAAWAAVTSPVVPWRRP